MIGLSFILINNLKFEFSKCSYMIKLYRDVDSLKIPYGLILESQNGLDIKNNNK